MVLESKGLGLEGGCFLGFLTGYEGLGSDERGGEGLFFLWVVWTKVGWIEVGISPLVPVET